MLVPRGVNDSPLLKHISEYHKLNYVGVVASENRWNATKKELEQIGVSKSFIQRVRAPAGLDINSVLLEEIAISILAEIIEVRRRIEFQRFEEARSLAHEPFGVKTQAVEKRI